MDENESDSLENVYCDFVLMEYWQDLEVSQVLKAIKGFEWGGTL